MALKAFWMISLERYFKYRREGFTAEETKEIMLKEPEVGAWVEDIQDACEPLAIIPQDVLNRFKK
jgi:hypothetical protein